MRNTSWFVGVVVLTVSWQQPASAQEARQAIGMFVQADGEVAIRRQSNLTTARLADFLYPGDRVTVGLGRVRLLYCPSLETIAMGDDSAIEITARNVQIVKGTPLARQKTDRCPILRLELGSESLERIGGFRARGPIIPLYVGGPISTSRPVFSWGSIPGAERYRFTLRDDNGDLLWEDVVTSTTIPYPDSKPALRAASYSWEIQAETSRRALAQQNATFEVRPANIRPRPSDEWARLIHAADLETAGYLAEAAAVFREIRSAHSNDARLGRHLAWLYGNAGLFTAAQKEIDLLEQRLPN